MSYPGIAYSPPVISSYTKLETEISSTKSTATWGLILAIIAILIMIIIIVLVLVFRNRDTFSTDLNWTIQDSVTGNNTTSVFSANANHILYRTTATTGANSKVTVTVGTTEAALNASSPQFGKGSTFKIDNTAGLTALSVVPDAAAGVTTTGLHTGDAIVVNYTATYIWDTTTSYHRLSTSLS